MQKKLIETLEKLSGKKAILKEMPYKREKVVVTDDSRINDIQTNSNGDETIAVGLASKMAKVIQDPSKAWNRYQAAIKVFGKDSEVTKVFYNRAEELKHPEVIIGKQNADLQAKKAAEASQRKDFQQTALASANPRDVERVNDMKLKVTKLGAKGYKLAEQMANLIKDPTKAYNRYLAATQTFGENDSVARIFLNRAAELQHPEAIRIKGESDQSSSEEYKLRREQSTARAKLKAEAFLKVFKSRYPDFRPTLNTYGDVSVTFDGGEKLRKGLEGLGDRRAISPMHAGIRNLADKFGGYYNCSYGGKCSISFK